MYSYLRCDQEHDNCVWMRVELNPLISLLRYHKIIIMTDADVDGVSYQNAASTFFYRSVTPLHRRRDMCTQLLQPPYLELLWKKKLPSTYSSDAEQDKLLLS